MTADNELEILWECYWRAERLRDKSISRYNTTRTNLVKFMANNNIKSNGLSKFGGNYSPNLEWLADRYRIITYAKQIEVAMAAKGFPGKIGFKDAEPDTVAIFFPKSADLKPITARGSSYKDSLVELIHKLISSSIKEYQMMSQVN